MLSTIQGALLMKDNRTKKVINICVSNVENGCREVCKLASACEYRKGDTKEIFDKRMNVAAVNLSDNNL